MDRRNTYATFRESIEAWKLARKAVERTYEMGGKSSMSNSPYLLVEVILRGQNDEPLKATVSSYHFGNRAHVDDLSLEALEKLLHVRRLVESWNRNELDELPETLIGTQHPVALAGLVATQEGPVRTQGTRRENERKGRDTD